MVTRRMGYHRAPRKYFWNQRVSSVRLRTGGVPIPVTLYWLRPFVWYRFPLPSVHSPPQENTQLVTPV